MPFLKVRTNLSKDKFPATMMPLITQRLAKIFGAPITADHIFWSLENDCQMSKVLEK